MIELFTPEIVEKVSNSISSEHLKRVRTLLIFLSGLFKEGGGKITSDSKENGVTKLLGWHNVIHDLSDIQLREGCKWAKNCGETFFPSAGRFRYKCLSLLEPNEAYDLWASGNQHPTLLATAQRITSWDFKHLTIEATKKRFTALYHELCKEISAGGILNLRPAIEEKDYRAPIKKADPVVANKYLDEIKKTLGMKDKKVGAELKDN
jgi:hypothetical protein